MTRGLWVPSLTRTSLMRSLHELEAAVVIIVLQHDEQSLELSTKAIADDLIDLDEVLLAERGRKTSDGWDEIVVTGATVGRTRGSYRDLGPSIIAADVVNGPWVHVLEALPELPKNGNPDFRLQGDLVPETHTLEGWWKLDWPTVPEKAREEVSDLLGGVEGVQLNVVGGRACLPLLEGVNHEQDLEVDSGAINLQDELETISHLPLHGCWPFLAGEAGQAWEPLEN